MGLKSGDYDALGTGALHDAAADLRAECNATSTMRPRRSICLLHMSTSRFGSDVDGHGTGNQLLSGAAFSLFPDSLLSLCLTPFLLRQVIWEGEDKGGPAVFNKTRQHPRAVRIAPR